MSSPFENLSGLAHAGVVENPDSDVSVENLNTSETQNSNQITVILNNIVLGEQQPPTMNSRPNPDPEAEVVVQLSPKSLMMRNRYVCEVCHKGFQRDQNLQLHRRGHNLPWKLKTTKSDRRKKVYLCPEATCPHHFRSRALGDMTGVKKHFLRKHCEKKYECPKCTKRYAVLSDLKAHLKNCGTNTYTCNCGLRFARRDTFRTHQAFCEVLTAETERVTVASHPRHGTSSEDSANESMVSFYEGNMSPPPGFQPVHRHQMSVPPLPGFHHHHQPMASGLGQGYVLKNEPISVDFRQASPLAMSQGGAMQNNHQQETGSAHHTTMSLFQTVDMIGRGSVEDMTGSMIMSQLQLGGSGGHNVAPPAEYYYYDLLMGTHDEERENEQPTRDFLRLSVGNGGGANYSTSMDEFIGSLGGTTNGNLGGFRGCGGGGVNVYSEGGEWVPGMAKVENAYQMYGFYGGPSS